MSGTEGITSGATRGIRTECGLTREPGHQNWLGEVKGKSLFRVQTAGLSPREGKSAPPKRRLGFYRVFLVGRVCSTRTLRRKELLQADRTAVNIAFRALGRLAFRTAGGCHQAVQQRQGVSRLLRHVEHFTSENGLGPTWVIHLRILGGSILGQRCGSATQVVPRHCEGCFPECSHRRAGLLQVLGELCPLRRVKSTLFVIRSQAVSNGEGLNFITVYHPEGH